MTARPVEAGDPRSAREYQSDLLVAAQLAAMTGVLWPGRPRWRLAAPARALALSVAAAGAALSASGVVTLGPDLRVGVEPVSGAPLHQDGAYRYSRHPIYTGLIAAAGGVAVLRRRPGPLLAWACLAGVLAAKIRAEDARLRDRFGTDFVAYAANTPRLVAIPFCRR